ncbi:MAG TPA: DNA-directed RNA polymerase subunit alpha [candidate division Zixibacteria bacterium]|nr:DNA-directed RNA polymerase subunit alpha [candidate division Zixibacteria bacterium]
MKWKSLTMPKEVQIKDVFTDEETKTTQYSKFVIEPLERGFGTTLGNNLRRALLSSIQGAAVTSLRIQGVLHPFSTISGVYEDVTEIILNIKKLRIRLLGDSPKTISVEMEKKGELKAGDFETDPEVEILNPDLHIATFTDNVKFKMELDINSGRGYVASEQNKDDSLPVGTIFIDSLFSPVTKVNFEVENTRVGQRTDYDKLILEIWTDGSITPENALSQASKIIKDHMQVFIKLDEEEQMDEEEKVDDETLRIRNLLKTRVDELELSVRSANCLRAANIQTIEDLVKKSEPEMLKFRNFGRKSLNELKKILDERGLHFGMDVEKYKEPAKAGVGR